MIDIKDTLGNVRFSTEINAGSKRKFLLMKEDYITLKFSLEKPVSFKLGDYVDDPRFGLFELCDLCKPTYNSSNGGYDFELRLDAYYWKWKNKLFKFTPEGGGQETSWSLTATLDAQMGIFIRNLNALGYKYRGKDFDFLIHDTVEKKSLPMSYDNSNLLDALFELAKKWDCECWVKDEVIHFGRCEEGEPIDFKLGENVEEMTRSDSQTNYATRIYAFGSTRNIPVNYRPVDESITVNGISQRRLMLPGGIPYIDAMPGMCAEEAIEQVVVFDNIYPRREGIISKVEGAEETETNETTGEETKYLAYSFKDAGFNFSDKYMLEGQELRMVFQSEKLNGCDFEVIFNPKGEPLKKEDGTWNPDAQWFKIKRNKDYGRLLPDNLLIPAERDTYVLYGWDASKIEDLGLVASAEKELEAEAKKYADKMMTDPSTYDNRMISGKLYKAGDRVNLINAMYFEDGSRQSRIIGYEYKLDIPEDSPVYTVGETAAYSRLGELESKVENVTYKGFNYAYTSGRGGSSSEASGLKLKKAIQVTAPQTGYFKPGYVIQAGLSWEDVLRKMLYEPVQATLKSSLSTSNDVEFGSAKGSITYTAARNGQGIMKKAFFDNKEDNKLNFSREEKGVQAAVRQLSGNYTESESYDATVVYAASAKGDLPELMLTNKISVNVRRKWFAGVVDSVPTNSAQVRALSESGLYTGPGTYVFTISKYKTFVICIPAGTMKEVLCGRYEDYNFMDLDSAKKSKKVSVNGADGSAAVEYTVYEFTSLLTAKETDKFSFNTI